MTTSTAVLLSLVTFAGCAEAGDPFAHGDDAPPATARALQLEPAELSIDIVDGRAVTQAYHVTLIDETGAREDVTDRAELGLADPRFGTWSHETVTIDGGAAGRTQIVARFDGVGGTAPLAVHVTSTHYEGDLRPSVSDRFASATPSTACATRLAYPAPGMLVPANLGTLDVRWEDTPANDLFEVRLTNAYVDRTIYTSDAHGLALTGAAWQVFATSRDHVAISIAAMAAADPTTKCVVAPTIVDVADADAAGAVYYTATDPGDATHASLVRHNLASGGATQPVPMTQMQTACVGCHAISRDGSKLAVTADAAGGRGAVVDLATGRLLPIGNQQRWSSATFTPDGAKLLAVTDGQLQLFEVASGRLLAAYESAMVTGNPEMSPDGTQVVSVETSGGSDWSFAGARVVLRSFDTATNTLGAPRTLVAFDADKDLQSYYPAFSPDATWVAITRSASGTSYASPDATVWVVATNGFTPPLALTAPDEDASWARWLPYANTLRGETVFFLSFSSTRAYGNQLPAGRAQIWVQPFFPGRAFEAGDITAPAYHAPFQRLETANHNAQWATGVVIP